MRAVHLTAGYMKRININELLIRDTALLIKYEMEHHAITFDLELAEVTAIKINIRGLDLAIIVAYNTPNYKKKCHTADYYTFFRPAHSVIAAVIFIQSRLDGPVGVLILEDANSISSA